MNMEPAPWLDPAQACPSFSFLPTVPPVIQVFISSLAKVDKIIWTVESAFCGTDSGLHPYPRIYGFIFIGEVTV